MPVLYARSDLVRVAVPVESGGCGEPHSRPMISGSPARIWHIDCPKCTQFLKNDNLWSANAARIPLTPDEERVIEQMKEEGARSRAQQEAVEAHISAEKARHALEAQQQQQSAEAERAMMELRLAQMSAEMDRLRQMLDGREAPAAEPVQKAPRATVKPSQTPLSTKQCQQCGGPLRRPGTKGPTPKSVCYDCRAKTASKAKSA